MVRAHGHMSGTLYVCAVYTACTFRQIPATCMYPYCAYPISQTAFMTSIHDGRWCILICKEIVKASTRTSTNIYYIRTVALTGRVTCASEGPVSLRDSVSVRQAHPN